MKTSFPSYLRVHRGEQSAQPAAPALSSTDQFWSAFSAATGWRVDAKHDRVRVLPAVQSAPEASGDTALPPVVKADAAELACRASAMAEEIEQLRTVVRKQEVELAAHSAAGTAAASTESAARAIEQTLQQALRATGFDAAAIYMLDDQTEHLKTRVVVGLPEDRLSDPPRSLRGCRADLEAMVQDVVVMDNLRDAAGEAWNAPEAAGAAICTAIFRGDLPIGTLWLFSQHPCSPEPSVTATAQLTATQVALQLAAAARTRQEQRNRHAGEALGEIAAWQYAALPVGNHLAPGWFVDGMIESPQRWSTGWHHWDVLPDGSLTLALAEATEQRGGAAMVAATAKAALVAHCGYRHTPRQLLQRLGDTLWQSSSCDQLISLLYLRLDPESGEGEVASAGALSALIAGPYGYRPLVHRGGQPLASTIDVDCFQGSFQLADGESLLAYGSGLQDDGIGQNLLGCSLRNACRADQNPLARIRREIADFPCRHERGLVCLTRRPE